METVCWPFAMRFSAATPEDITCYAKKPKAVDAFEAKITQRVFKGSTTTFQLTVDENRSLTMSQDNIRSDQIVGDTMWVAIEPAYLSVLLR